MTVNTDPESFNVDAALSIFDYLSYFNPAEFNLVEALYNLLNWFFKSPKNE